VGAARISRASSVSEAMRLARSTAPPLVRMAVPALKERRIYPDLVAGVSIGAFNAAIIAGNPRHATLEADRGVRNRRARSAGTRAKSPTRQPHSAIDWEDPGANEIGRLRLRLSGREDGLTLSARERDGVGRRGHGDRAGRDVRCRNVRSDDSAQGYRGSGAKPGREPHLLLSMGPRIGAPK
jgi:hypothetical protein